MYGSVYTLFQNWSILNDNLGVTVDQMWRDRDEQLVALLGPPTYINGARLS